MLLFKIYPFFDNSSDENILSMKYWANPLTLQTFDVHWIVIASIYFIIS